MTLLRVRGLARTHGDLRLLGGLDLDVEPGEAVAVTGPNGAGKSTFLRCVLGTETATEGTVELDGRPLDERDPRVRRDVASVMDDADFFPDLSVVEHLDLLARAHGVLDTEPVVDEVLRQLGLVDQSGQLPGTLSSGQRRRLALGAAFVRPRRLLVLDEPEARLDVAGLDWLCTRLVEEKGAGLALLLASHSPRLVEAVADRELELAGRPG